MKSQILRKLLKNLKQKILNFLSKKFNFNKRELQKYQGYFGMLDDASPLIRSHTYNKVNKQENDKKKTNYNDVGFIEKIENYLNDKEPNLQVFVFF